MGACPDALQCPLGRRIRLEVFTARSHTDYLHVADILQQPILGCAGASTLDQQEDRQNGAHSRIIALKRSPRPSRPERRCTSVSGCQTIPTTWISLPRVSEAVCRVWGVGKRACAAKAHRAVYSPRRRRGRREKSLSASRNAPSGRQRVAIPLLAATNGPCG